MKTIQIKINTISRYWHLVDAKNQVLGRLATGIARSILGKGKRQYAPHVDCGDFVVVVNADKIRITGNSKPDQKIDFRHSHYPGGHTMTPYREFLKTNPERAIYLAVSGMLPKNRLRKRQLSRLRVFRGERHPHAAQFKKTEPAVAAEVN